MSHGDYRQENLFKSKTLIGKPTLTKGNWFEDRSNHGNQSHHFDHERRANVVDNFTLTKQEFNKTNDNWLSFQTMPSSETYKTIYKYCDEV